jgi:hypothetical protein
MDPKQEQDENALLRTLWRPDRISGRTQLLEIRAAHFCKNIPDLYTI